MFLLETRSCWVVAASAAASSGKRALFVIPHIRVVCSRSSLRSGLYQSLKTTAWDAQLWPYREKGKSRTIVGTCHQLQILDTYFHLTYELVFMNVAPSIQSKWEFGWLAHVAKNKVENTFWTREHTYKVNLSVQRREPRLATLVSFIFPSAMIWSQKRSSSEIQPTFGIWCISISVQISQRRGIILGSSVVTGNFKAVIFGSYQTVVVSASADG